MLKIVFAVFSGVVLSSGAASAQSLPTLGKAAEINTGEFPGGLTYYIVKNDRLPGFADFALVQPGRTGRNEARRDLVEAQHLGGVKPYEFLARAGVRYGTRGFIRHQRDATVFRFENVPVNSFSYSDTTLIMLFDFLNNSPSKQAIVISGDVDVSAMKERIRILSMTLPQLQDTDGGYSYAWRTQDSVAVTTSTGPVGSIRIIYRSPRTESELMNTIQPLMSKLMAREFDIVLSRRLRAAFTQAGIPLADYRFRYTGSDETAGDELYTITVETAPDSCKAAIATVAGVLAALNFDGVTSEEMTFARRLISEEATRDDDNIRLSNSQYLDKCISAYLYGANLASYAAVSAVFSGRRTDIERERELLNRYVSATISSKRNMHLHVRAPRKPDAKESLAVFREGWAQRSAAESDIPLQSDTLTFAQPRSKVRVRNSSTDPFSGGKVWTFSNGATVIFKKTADKGAFHYGLMMKGGWNEIPGISGTEPAFTDDVLALGQVAWMSGERFSDLLAMNGITMKGSASLSDLRYTGTAPSNKLWLVLKALLSVCGRSSADEKVYQRYLTEESVRRRRDKYSAEGTRAVLDSIMCPDYAFATGSLPPLPGDDFADRTFLYLRQKGTSIRNAVFVLAGDLDETATQKTLSQMLSGFGTNQHRVARPRIDYPMRECWSSAYTRGDWREKGVTVSLSAEWPYSGSSNLTLSLACAVLEAELSRALAPIGWTYSVSWNGTLLPSEKITVYINSYPVAAGGLPEGITAASPYVALAVVRKVLNRLATEETSPEVLSLAKTTISGRVAATEKETALLRDRILDRNAIGRDLNSPWKDRIKSVKASDVRAIFAELDGCKCEFTVL